jgi:hypothetical protein
VSWCVSSSQRQRQLGHAGTPACDLASSCMIQQKPRLLSKAAHRPEVAVQARGKVVQIPIVGQIPSSGPIAPAQTGGVFPARRDPGSVALWMGDHVGGFLIGSVKSAWLPGKNTRVIDGPQVAQAQVIARALRKGNAPAVGYAEGPGPPRQQIRETEGCGQWGSRFMPSSWHMVGALSGFLRSREIASGSQHCNCAQAASMAKVLKAASRSAGGRPSERAAIYASRQSANNASATNSRQSRRPCAGRWR